jgi:hypothetical protein
MAKKRTNSPYHKRISVENSATRKIYIDMEADGYCFVHEVTEDLHTRLTRGWLCKSLAVAKTLAAKVKAAPRQSVHATEPI